MDIKIYIHTDIEGISGIDSINIIDKNNPCYRYSVERLIADVNAAVDGAYAGGASHVTVLDSHGGGGNFDISLLDKRAEIDTRDNKKWWGKLDNSYGGTFFIGAHSMAGTMNGFLDHTQSSNMWYNYWVNGRRVGELAQWAMVAAHYGVALLMVSGDEAACAEARDFFNPIECVAVKKGMGRNQAKTYDLEQSVEKIRETARSAVSLVGKVKPFTPLLPMELKLEFCRSDYCDMVAHNIGVERIDARTVRKVAYSYLDLFFD